MKTLEKILDEFPAERWKEVKARAAQLIAEETTLQELRKAHRKTPTQLARKLHMTQGQISRLEQRSDLLLSTLRRFVEGMGGQLSLIAEFPARNPVRLLASPLLTALSHHHSLFAGLRPGAP